MKKDEVTYTQNFAGVIRKIGHLAKLVLNSTVFFQHEINKFEDGTLVTLEMHNKRPKRTIQQNRYYWGAYLPLIAEETGERDLDRLHELFKGKFLTTKIVEVLGEPVRIKKSTTTLSVSDFSRYIMDIETFTGVAAPPTENYNLAPLRNKKLK